MLKAIFGFFWGAVASAIVVWILVERDVDTLIVPPDAVLPDTSQYYGDIVDGKFQGKGRLITANGTRYIGGFVDGLFSGQGEVSYKTGEHYEGKFKNGFMDGYGEFIGSNGEVYKGEFTENRFDGEGVFISARNETYSGEFKMGNFSGEGKYDDGKGNHYAGGFLKWSFNGKGKYTSSAGNIYEGDFKDGVFSGQGRMISENKGIFEGQFDNWLLNGKGSFSTEEGRKYTGLFEDGILNGVGEYQNGDKESYKGEFRDWMYHGKGELTEKDGSVYTGQFEYGYKNGQGELSYVGADGERKVQKGEWEHGSFVDPDKAEKYKKLTNNVENIIYSQNELLDDYLSLLQAGTKGKPELYFIGVAANGKQDVFLKEVKFIKSSLDKRFDMSSRSLLLSNNQATFSELPLATRVSLESALKTISEKMNLNEDILFLYITSHGSSSHEISLSNKGFKLPDISAEELGHLVRKSPIKWKIIAVSACYSGGFIPDLKDDNTLIITAARDDRMSFGCSNTSDMTYFGKAYFKEALPVSRSFVEAFDAAKLIIEKWEDEDIKKDPDEKHSYPQIYVGKKIEEYLPKWWKENI